MLKRKNKCYGVTLVTEGVSSLMVAKSHGFLEMLRSMLRHVTVSPSVTSITYRNIPCYGDKASHTKDLRLSVTP